jgi:hypothetical protein
MMSLVKREVSRDRNDIFNRVVGWVVIPCLLVYIVFALVNPHVATPIVEGNRTVLLTISRDSLLRMTYDFFFPFALQSSLIIINITE